MNTRKAYISLITLALVLFTAGLAQAHPYKAPVEKRQFTQSKRIHQGVKNGALTKGELRQLKWEQKKIEMTQRQFLKTGGHIDPKERFILNKMQNQASEDLFRFSHNRYHY